MLLLSLSFLKRKKSLGKKEGFPSLQRKRLERKGLKPKI